ncbi:MAG TPA: carboxylating nicotinate-nucleotide diphosphorylase [Candidatus Baltobacteraceae bacterium]
MPNARLRASAASLNAPSRLVVEPIVRAALLEDIGHGGDLTTDAIVDAGAGGSARIVARTAGVIAGFNAASLAFTLLDGDVAITPHAADGDLVDANATIAHLRGRARALLTGERTAINVLGRLCGIATLTHRFVLLTRGTSARITDTRKTTPGLRVLEKYAVRCGGGVNHRFGLDDAVLVKDNHVAAAGSVATAVEAVRASIGHMVKVQVEVDTLAQLREALDAGVDAVLLDNMSLEQLAEAVRIVNRRAVIEASGGVTVETVAAIAATGVDLISSGALTHSAPALDVALDWD